MPQASVLKLTGSKRRVVDMIADCFPMGACPGVYHEPFFGTGAVFFHLRRMGRIEHAVLSDANEQLAHFWRTLKNAPLELIAALQPYRDWGEDWPDRYYAVREVFNEGVQACDESVEQAARFIWLNKAGFRGVYRVNKKGLFNIPKGNSKVVALPSNDMLAEHQRLLKGCRILAGDFRGAARRVRAADWVYVDPPYVSLDGKSSFTSYTAGRFLLEEQRDLAGLCLPGHGFGRADKLLISNHSSTVTDRLYPEAVFERVRSYSLARTIRADSPSRAPEVLMAPKGASLHVWRGSAEGTDGPEPGSVPG